jgi:uncharacterized protein
VPFKKSRLLKEVKKLKRKLVLWMLLAVLLVSIFSVVGCTNSKTEAIKVPVAETDTYVYDQANIVDDSVKNRLNAMLVDLEKKTDVEFAVVTVPNLSGLSVEDYSIEIANSLKIGKADTNNGILLLVSAAETSGNVRLEIGRGIEDILNDAKCGRILDEFFVPYRDDGQLGEAIDKTTQAVVNVVATDKAVAIDGVDKRVIVEDDDKLPIGYVIAIAIVVIIVIAFVVFFSDGFDDGSGGGGFFYGSSGGSSGSGSSGGGFGGGSFGGGGASR